LAGARSVRAAKVRHGDAELPPVTDTLAFNETMSGVKDSVFDYAAATASLPHRCRPVGRLMLIGIVAFGLLPIDGS